MKILVDTSVWSLAFRREDPDEAVTELKDIILSSMAVMIGPVRQELLSGIRDENMYNRLKASLSAFIDLPIQTIDYETAAHFFNICRKNGVQGSHIDFLICAVASNHNLLIYTVDKDFLQYKRFLPIRLYT